MEIKIGNPVPKTVNLFYNVLCFHQYNPGGSHMDQISLALNKDNLLSFLKLFISEGIRDIFFDLSMICFSFSLPEIIKDPPNPLQTPDPDSLLHP